METTKELLNNLAHMCGETTGATFAITCLKDKSWQVAFPNSGLITSVKGKDIDAVLLEAIAEVAARRRPLETETKYTVYKY